MPGGIETGVWAAYAQQQLINWRRTGDCRTPGEQLAAEVAGDTIRKRLEAADRLAIFVGPAEFSIA